jgi:hypothetical protein
LERTSPPFTRRITIIFLLVVFLLVAFYGLYVWLDWRILQTMYQKKAGIDWFDTVFYHNYTFIVAALLSLIVLNPRPGRSDLWEAYGAAQSMLGGLTGFREPVVLPTFGLGKVGWAFWQFLKWVLAFLYIMPNNGLPIFGNLTIAASMAAKGVGDWTKLFRVLLLPIVPASGPELIALTPTMEVQYRLFFYVASAVAIVIALRMLLKFIRDFATVRRESWLRDIFLGFAFIVLIVLFEAPYWRMDVRTPYEYAIAAALVICFLFVGVAFQVRGVGTTLALARRRRLLVTVLGVLLLVILLGNALIVTGFTVNWNNNWIEYEWQPLTAKQIAVTRWAAGIDPFKYQSLSAIPSGNASRTLSVIRQWDQEAAITKMKNQIGVNWMKLADSDVIYYGGREYWVAPTTVLYPSSDWISRRLIYTHASKVICLDSHNGEYVPVSNVFGLKAEPPIYYGEGFRETVYVQVKGFREVEEISYSKDADYALSGWQRMLWFLAEGQLGFAFSSPQDEIKMLYKRDILTRIQSILIYGLALDEDVYLVSDGQSIYYAAQVLIDYPLQSGFSASTYQRLFGYVLVNVEDGRLQGYVVAKSDGFLVDFYKDYYPNWTSPPSWLVPQLRYSEQLLGMHDYSGQLDIDFKFHVADPFVWRAGSAFFERPPATLVHYILLLSDEDVRFVGIQLVEYRASAGKNLAGLYVAYGGPGLGEVVLYGVGNVTMTQLIGPSAALQALETDDYVRTQLTLLTNRRLGNILLYSIAGKLYYFIPVYIVTQEATAVITKMAFVVAIDALTGAKVATGSDAAQAYYALVGGKPPVVTGYENRLTNIRTYLEAKKLAPINVTKITANAEIEVDKINYLDETQWQQTTRAIDSFLKEYVSKTGATEVYTWNQDPNSMNLGVLVFQGGIVRLYYMTIRVR